MPDTYLFRKQGTAEGEMIGDSMYGRYLGLKLRLEFPTAPNEIDLPTSLQVYFITVFPEMALTDYTTPTAVGVTKNQVKLHVENQLKQWYNSIESRMDFPDKMAGFRVDKRVDVLPDRNTQIGRPQSMVGGGVTTAVGTVPDFFCQHSWDIKQKMHYEKFDAGGADTHYLNRPGPVGYKCMVVFNPDWQHMAGQTNPATIEYDWNACFWAGDS